MGTIKESTEIFDGITYKTKTFPALQACKLQVRVARILPPTLQLFLEVDWHEFKKAIDEDVLPKQEDETDVSFKQLLMHSFVESSRMCEPDEFASLCKALTERTECDNIADSGQPGLVSAHFDTHFAGRFEHQGKVLIWLAHKLFTGP